MSKLIYIMPTSLDGFIAGETDDMDWSAPDEEVMAFINDLHRPIGTYLYGRKNYEVMTVWETPEVIPDPTPTMIEFGRIWQAADKIVYSKSLEAGSTPKTRIEREFVPQVVRDLKAQRPHDISVSGPNLAAQAIRAGLVDEYHLLVVPMMLGGGNPILPDNTREAGSPRRTPCRQWLGLPSLWHAGLIWAFLTTKAGGRSREISAHFRRHQERQHP